MLSSAKEDFGLIQKAREINEDIPLFAKDLLMNALKMINITPEKAVVVVLGLAYKGDSDDIRNSPALAFIEGIKEDVKEVRSYDPYVKGTHETLEEALKGADAVVIATDHSQFKNLDWEKIGSLMRNRILIDGRYVVKTPPKGFVFKGLGRGEY